MSGPIVIPVYEITEPPPRNSGAVRLASAARNKAAREEIRGFLDIMQPGQGFKVLGLPINKVKSMISNFDVLVATRQMWDEAGEGFVQVWVR